MAGHPVPYGQLESFEVPLRVFLFMSKSLDRFLSIIDPKGEINGKGPLL